MKQRCAHGGSQRVEGRSESAGASCWTAPVPYVKLLSSCVNGISPAGGTPPVEDGGFPRAGAAPPVPGAGALP